MTAASGGQRVRSPVLAGRAGAISRGYIKLNGLVGTGKDNHRDVMPRFWYGRAAHGAGHCDMDANLVGRVGDGIKLDVIRPIGFIAGVGDQQRGLLEINSGQILGYFAQVVHPGIPISVRSNYRVGVAIRYVQILGHLENLKFDPRLLSCRACGGKHRCEE